MFDSLRGAVAHGGRGRVKGGIVCEVSYVRRTACAAAAFAVAAGVCGCAGNIAAPSVSSTGERSQYVRPATAAATSAVASRPMFTVPLRTVTCSYTPEGGGVVYLSATVGADGDSVCDGRPMLSESEINSPGVILRCATDTSAATELDGQGFVSVYSDSEPANLRASETLCS